jgi:hypothetical protein
MPHGRKWNHGGIPAPAKGFYAERNTEWIGESALVRVRGTCAE